VHAHFPNEAAIRDAWADYPLSTNDTWLHPEVPPPHKIGQKPPAESAARQANYTTHQQEMMISWATGLSKAIKAVDHTRLVSVGELSLATGALLSKPNTQHALLCVSVASFQAVLMLP